MGLNTKLPDKPSKLIKIAVRDMEKCMRDSRYEIDMRVWHGPGFTGKCKVCLAGSVLAKTVKLPIAIDYCTTRLDDNIDNKLALLDEFRKGYFDSIGRNDLTNAFSCQWDANNPQEVAENLLMIAGILEADGQ